MTTVANYANGLWTDTLTDALGYIQWYGSHFETEARFFKFIEEHTLLVYHMDIETRTKDMDMDEMCAFINNYKCIFYEVEHLKPLICIGSLANCNKEVTSAHKIDFKYRDSNDLYNGLKGDAIIDEFDLREGVNQGLVSNYKNIYNPLTWYDGIKPIMVIPVVQLNRAIPTILLDEVTSTCDYSIFDLVRFLNYFIREYEDNIIMYYSTPRQLYAYRKRLLHLLNGNTLPEFAGENKESMTIESIIDDISIEIRLKMNRICDQINNCALYSKKMHEYREMLEIYKGTSLFSILIEIMKRHESYMDLSIIDKVICTAIHRLGRMKGDDYRVNCIYNSYYAVTDLNYYSENNPNETFTLESIIPIIEILCLYTYYYSKTREEGNKLEKKHNKYNDLYAQLYAVTDIEVVHLFE